MNSTDSDLILEGEVSSNKWSIRPCHLYKEEYRDCRSIKARFQQYFVHGDSLDCSSWEHDFENCTKFEEKGDLKAGAKVIENERERRQERMKNHYGNTVWKKRDAPPNDWNRELPDHIKKGYENSFLERKSKELKGIPDSQDESSNNMHNSRCSIM